MKINAEKVHGLIGHIDHVLETIKKAELDNALQIQAAHPAFKRSVLNLIHYRAMRTIDITSLQKKLRYLGLSRIARAEAHVLASLQQCRFILNALTGNSSTQQVKPYLSIKKAISYSRAILATYLVIGRKVAV